MILIAGASTDGLHGQAPREVEQVVHSEADPAADILVDRAFSFLGRTSASVMNNQATAERFWFVRSEDGRIARIVVVHFERWKDGVEGAFRYPTFRMQRLGSNDYLHQSFPFEASCDVVPPEVRAMIQRAKLSMAKECVGTRFVRAASKDLRSELILFYLEPMDVLPSTDGYMPGGLPKGYGTPNAPETPWGARDRRLTEEALRVIKVRDRP